MKKIFLSLFATAFLFSACGNDNDNEGAQTGETGSLSGTIVFSEVLEKATVSTAIPKTSWDNIKTMRLFLYDGSGGEVRFSKEIPKAQASSFTIQGIPSGTYKLAIIANVKSSVDKVSTTVNNWLAPSEFAEFSDANVKSKKWNTQLGIDFKKGVKVDFPTDFEAVADIQKVPVSTSEIFVAYADNVLISSTTPTEVNNIALERVVSLMRARIKIDKVQVETWDELSFTDAGGTKANGNSILVHNAPKQMNIAAGAVVTGTTESDVNRVIVGAAGANTYRVDKPSLITHSEASKPTVQGDVLMNEFDYWQEFVVFPNAGGAAARNFKYFIVISAWGSKDHVLANGNKINGTGAQVYWYGDINETFTLNKIREVNITVATGGTITIPPGPVAKGDLIIKCADPISWNSVIEQSYVEM